VQQTYVYDDEDRLVSRGNQSYSYNGFNTRTKITVNGGLTTEFHRDGVGVTSPVISEGNGGATKHVTPGISEKWGAGASKFMHGGLKDVNAWTDAAQNVTESNKYDAYGRALPGSSGWANRFGYGGKFGYQSDGGDLQLLGHRYYDSSTGTFITRDPIKDGRNWYSYCENNPVNLIDANGLEPGKPYDTMDEAAEAAMQEAADKAQSTTYVQSKPDGSGTEEFYGVEYGGLIYELNGKYYYTTPRTDGRPNQVYPEGDNLGKEYVKKNVPAGAKIVADYHVHPDCYNDNLSVGLSPGDKSDAINRRRIAYVGFARNGSILCFDPSKESTRRLKKTFKASGKNRFHRTRNPNGTTRIGGGALKR
jgi:RHS repeat-associated protein